MFGSKPFCHVVRVDCYLYTFIELHYNLICNIDVSY